MEAEEKCRIRWGYLEDQGVDGRKILNSIFEKYDVCLDWIALAQDRDRGPVVV